MYVEHLSDPDGPGTVHRLPDPAPAHPVPGAPWWPLVMLDETWIREHAEDFDLYHLHFGFDQTPPAALRRIVDTLHELGKAFVYTVHDLRNPHQEDPAAQDAALDVLVPAADALITLTPGAARAIHQRWGRTATVVPHPHVLPLHAWAPHRSVPRTPTVGLHLKSMRTNMSPLPVARVLLAAAARGDIHLVLDAHTDVVTPGARHHDPRVVELLAAARTTANTTVHVHDIYSDEQLREYLRALDLSVLAYRFGTHSGWLELCRDLGTRVLAPTVGFYHEQHPGVLGFEWDASGRPRAEQIDAAVAGLAGSPAWQAGAEDRAAQRRRIAAAHEDVYRRALAARAAREGDAA
ncbi:glycosyltransferase family 1 protein [Kocuria sp.]|uniref:glycosyltransferase family 1 protein n=1 Tax=Kocuria sp. TaxID=1871328 RepID=UPI0026DC35B7|nr:glycosyltransferase family 1 protein [Kocuria sp.]MDO4920045.1 glycosyltransferase family 1 protein [Kocuria sp.]